MAFLDQMHLFSKEKQPSILLFFYKEHAYANTWWPLLLQCLLVVLPGSVAILRFTVGGKAVLSPTGSTTSRSLWQCTGGPVFPHLHQCLLFSIFWVTAVLVRVQCDLTVVLILIFLMTDNEEHLSTCFLVLCVSA